MRETSTHQGSQYARIDPRQLEIPHKMSYRRWLLGWLLEGILRVISEPIFVVAFHGEIDL